MTLTSMADNFAPVQAGKGLPSCSRTVQPEVENCLYPFVRDFDPEVPRRCDRTSSTPSPSSLTNCSLLMEGEEGRNTSGSASPFARFSAANKEAHLPRLARRHSGEGLLQEDGPSRLTLSERLARMRIEDGRRERNRKKAAEGQSQRAPAQAGYAAFSTPSASARAGTLYHQSSQLSQKDVAQRREASALRSKYAGPAPPTSWRASDQPPLTNVKGAVADTGRAKIDLATRRQSTAALRLFIDGESSATAVTSSVTSLRDACLIRIAESCHHSIHDALAKESIALLPMHLKERLLALAGREQKCEGLNNTSSALLFDSYRSDTSASPTMAASVQRQEHSDWHAVEEEKEEEGEGGGGWEGRDRAGYSVLAARITNLDLSYATIEHKRLRSILTRGIDATHLRTLSLAGWGQQDQQKSLSSIHDLMEMIGNLVHLETFSLAKSSLSSVRRSKDSERDEACITPLLSKESRMLESMTFLKRLSRASLRLKVLDLSECDWIVGPDVANLGWYSIEKAAVRSKIIWPRLQHLVLHNCSAFIETRTKSDVLQRSPSFVAKWHAAHHGIAVVTDSPYLLDHRPGLGRALFQASDPQAERRERQARLRRSLASGRGEGRRKATDSDDDDDVWGSPRPTGFGSDRLDGNTPSTATFQTSSSSAYPTRCPVSGVHVRSWEWERARVLDAVRGRWGSAINGNDALHLTGAFIQVYF